MKKSAVVLLFMTFLSVAALGQTVQEGINHFYAERYESAKNTFDKLIASNPNDIEAIFWLGQTLITQKEVETAKSVYDKAAASSNNAPLILVGQGHVALLQGKKAEAMQLFETAINNSKGRKKNDPEILNAIGRVNVESYTESNQLGDLDYAIAKLQEAAELTEKKENAEIYLNLGNAYRKKREGGSGGLAVQNYRKALEINPSFAIAPYRTAMLYKTQVNYRQPDSWTVVLENLNSAVAADPSFAPAYEQLYYFYLLGKKDFATAETFAAKYISNSDPSVENDYLKAQTDWVQGKFNEAITTAKNIITQTNDDAKPRVYRLLGYSYMGVKDTATACQYVEQFFDKASEEDIVGQDYLLHAQTCGKNNPDMIRASITKAVEMDSVLSRQLEMLDAAIADAKKAKQRLLEGELGLIRFSLLGEDANPALLVSLGTPFYYGSQFEKADSLFAAYSKAFPDSIYGYMWSTRALVQIDTTMELGLAVPAYEQVLRVAETDTTRDLYISAGTQAAGYLTAYYNNVKGDKETALKYIARGLAIDPGNSTLLSYQRALQATGQQSGPRPNSGNSKKNSNTDSK